MEEGEMGDKGLDFKHKEVINILASCIYLGSE